MSKKQQDPITGGLPNPTERELEIVRVLWKQRAASVREVLERLNRERVEPLAYTTVLRFLQIMTEKGLVTREDGVRGHLYSTSVPAESTKRQLAHDLIERAFEGSAHDLMLHALGGRKITQEELGEIRKLVEELHDKEEKSS